MSDTPANLAARRARTLIAGAAVLALLVGATGCTGGNSTTASSAAVTSAATSSSKPSAAPSNAAEVQAQVCPAVPASAVSGFFASVSHEAATSCRPVSNTAAAWTTKSSKRPDLLTVSVFDRPYGTNCGLNTYGSPIEKLTLKAHSAALVSRGRAGGLFLCWSSSPQRVVLMSVNTPPAVDYASIRTPAVTLASSLIGHI